MSQMKTLNGFEVVDAAARAEIENIKNNPVDLSPYAKKIDIPTDNTELTNGAGYITAAEAPKADLTGYAKESWVESQGYLKSVPAEYVTESELSAKGYLTEHQNLSAYAKKTEVPTKLSDLDNDKGYITTIPAQYVTETELESKGYLTAIPSQYVTETELEGKGYIDAIPSEYAKKTDIPTVPTNVSAFTNDAGYLTQHQSLLGYATMEYVDKQLDLYTDDLATTKYVDNKIEQIPQTDLSNYYNKTEVDSKIPSLTGYATEAWVEGKGYITQHQDLSEYAKKSEVPSIEGLATTKYVDDAIANIDVSGGGTTDLTNYYTKAEVDALIPDDYLTSIPAEYVTDTELTNKGYQTAEQVNALINKALGVIENGTY